MATSFAAQLRTIAQNSTHELDLRARRDAHAESLLFPKEVAIKQSFDGLFAICTEGFREICALDPAFVEFQSNLFSAQSVRTEREQMNKSENEALNRVLGRCLTMLGSRLLLKPGVRCLEWLVRRFRVHILNTTDLLLAVLPWHEMSIWRNVLSIVPKERCTGEWKFLGMYKEEALNIPRSAMIYAMTNNDGFFSLLNRYVIDGAREGIAHTGLLQFWTGLVAEAVIGRLDAARSGRREVQRQRTEDLLLKILPVLSDGFDIRDCPDLTTACLTLAVILAGKADLEDRVLDSILQAVAAAGQRTEDDRHNIIVTIYIIVQYKQQLSVPKAVIDLFMSLPDLRTALSELLESYKIEKFIEALVTGAITSAKRKTADKRSAFIENLLISGHRLGEDVSVALQTVLLRVLQLDTADMVENNIRSSLFGVLRHLNEEVTMSVVLSSAFQKLNRDPSELEALLGSTMTIIEADSTKLDDAMEIDLPATSITSIDRLFEKIPSRTVDTISFLGKHDHHLYQQLVNCFTQCCGSTQNLQSFTSLSIWESIPSEGLLLCSFFLRVVHGPFTSTERSAALQILIHRFEDLIGDSDAQALLPYVLSALLDNSQTVRRFAAELLLRIEANPLTENEAGRKFSSGGLYEERSLASLKWIEVSRWKKIVAQALLPDLEECVLDASCVVQTVQSVLTGQDVGKQTPTKSNHAELKKSVRSDFFELLVSHAIATPVLRVKMSIIRLLQNVAKVGHHLKSTALAPVLEDWSKSEESVVAQATETEQLLPAAVDAAMVDIISAQDKAVIQNIMATLEGKDVIPRVSFKVAIFNRLQALWKNLKHDMQTWMAERFFELAFEGDRITSTGAQAILRSVHLESATLAALLDRSTGIISQLHHGDQHPKKKRRTSTGRDSLPPDMAKIAQAAHSRMTLALELIDGSNPERRPELLPTLFDALAFFKRFKQEQWTSMSYLQNLCLSDILAIIETQRAASKVMIDTSAIRADLVTDSIISSENSQVQTTALLLAANLASIAPDRVLHSVMPIFTFMGQNIISKDDDHSIHVINQAIDQIVPALVGSLRDQNKNLIRSTSSLLASFTAAFDHIPQYRRIPTYARLLDRMGSQDYTYVLIAMLAQRKMNHSSFDTFLHDLLDRLDINTHLSTFQKLIQLSNDVRSTESPVLEDIFDTPDLMSQEERQKLAKTICQVALRVLESESIKSRTRKLHKLDDNVANSLRQEIDSAFRLILSTIHELNVSGDDTVGQARLCLAALLAVLPLAELFGILPRILLDEHVADDLKPQALKVMVSRIQGNPSRDTRTRAAAVEFAEKLTEMLQTGMEVTMKRAVIVCLDRITEIYGRKDIDMVISAASIVASDNCLGSSDRRVQMMALLCLASMIEVLKESCIPIIPEIMPKILEILRAAIKDEPQDDALHNAVFALVTTIVSHVAFLVSDDVLGELLVLSSISVSRYNSSLASESRKEALSTIARKVDLASLSTTLLSKDINVMYEHSTEAQIEKLDMLSTAIETGSKADVVRNVDALSQLLLAYLDQRSRQLRTLNTTDGDNFPLNVEHVEDKINDVAIKLIYRLNDTSFRPVFESWVDWATNANDIEESLREATVSMRRISFLRLVTYFFDTLKSIVTSYASYILPLSNHILMEAASLIGAKRSGQFSKDTKFWETFLAMLRASFSHDVDGFYNSPSHFEPVASPLVSQLGHASVKSLRHFVTNHVVPTIVSLATATLDTPSHHQAISHDLVQLRHASSAAVRLASIKTFVAITSDENVGDEFIANVIGIGSGEGEGARGMGGGGSVGEIMIYVNEMLEDDDEDVEREVRKWVQSVREKTGEEVFEV